MSVHVSLTHKFMTTYHKSLHYPLVHICKWFLRLPGSFFLSFLPSLWGSSKQVKKCLISWNPLNWIPPSFPSMENYPQLTLKYPSCPLHLPSYRPTTSLRPDQQNPQEESPKPSQTVRIYSPFAKYIYTHIIYGFLSCGYFSSLSLFFCYFELVDFSYSRVSLKEIIFLVPDILSSRVASAQVEEQVEVEIAEGYTITQFCDKIIDLFLNEKPKPKDWRKYLVFREEWKKYRDSFYNRCQARALSQTDSEMKQKLMVLARKVKKV